MHAGSSRRISQAGERREEPASRKKTTATSRNSSTPANKFILIDTREDTEWARGHIPGAVHLGKGVIERDIEKTIPDKDATLVLYCGGGFRSALAADNLQKMGYRNVISMDGGWRGWTEAGFPVRFATSPRKLSRCDWGIGWGGWTRTNTVLINSEVSYQLDHAPTLQHTTMHYKDLLDTAASG